MAKRAKRLRKAIESYIEEIEKHFEKLDSEINEGDDILAGYHIKEIDKSLIKTLERKISHLNNQDLNSNLTNKLREKLESYKKKLNIES